MPGGVRRDREQPVGRDALLLALQGEGLDRLDVDRVPDQPVGRLAQEDLVGGGGLLEASAHVHRIAGDQALAGRGVAGHHLAGIDADPHAQPLPVHPLEIAVQRGEGLPHADRGADGAERVVLVQARDPEDRHHGVADELLDGAAVALDHGGHLVEVAAHHAAECLGIEPLPERGRPRDVGEDDRHDLSDVGRGSISPTQRGRAVLTETSPLGVLLAAAGAALHGPSIEGQPRPSAPRRVRSEDP